LSKSLKSGWADRFRPGWTYNDSAGEIGIGPSCLTQSRKHMEAKKLRTTELAANIAIVVVALLVMAVVVKQNLLGSTGSGRHQVSAGEKISVPGVDWSSHDKTVVLAISQGCHFCSESASFYQRVAQAVRANSDAQLVVSGRSCEVGGWSAINEGEKAAGFNPRIIAYPEKQRRQSS
jgi:hypothetical protein